MINFCIMATGTASVVMIDHSGAPFGQGKGLRQRHLLAKNFPAFAAVELVNALETDLIRKKPRARPERSQRRW
jgi:hypothetical protein